MLRQILRTAVIAIGGLGLSAAYAGSEKEDIKIVKRPNVTSSAPLAASGYTFNTIDVDVPGASETAVNGNSEHALAGQYNDAGGTTHGFVLSNGVYTTIDKPGSVNSGVNGINDRGHLAGTYVDAAGASHIHAYFSQGGQFVSLDPPGSVRTFGGTLNDSDHVVGFYRTGDQKRHGFTWYKGSFSTFNVPNDHPVLGTSPLGINNRGDIVGSYVDVDGVRHGFVLSHGAYASLDVPGAMITVAQQINESQVIAGLYIDQSGNQHGFVLDRGSYKTVDVPNSTYTAIYTINAQGVIGGQYGDAGGIDHGFVGTPGQRQLTGSP